jgi:peptide/nickel transport system substrate-binding protein
VRQAIQLTLDHAAIMQAAFGEGFYELTPTLLPGAEVWYSEAGSDLFNRNDPDEARRVLAESGYNGETLRLLTTQEIQQEYNGSVVIKQQLEAVGFTVDLQVYDGATLSDRRDEEDLWEIYGAWASFRSDPVLRNLTCSATGWWCTAEKDELLAQLASESDFQVRYGIWEQIQQAFFEEVPRLKIGDSRRILVRSPQLRGLSVSTNMQPEFSNAWLAV